MRGSVNYFILFLAAGAELAPENDFEETALALAIAKGHTDCADLIEAKSNHK
jgi:ankyrin repeat protein